MIWCGKKCPQFSSWGDITPKAIFFRSSTLIADGASWASLWSAKGPPGTPYRGCHQKSGLSSLYKISDASNSSQVRMVFSGFEVGFGVNSGGALTSCATSDNPCRQAYVDYVGEGKDRLGQEYFRLIKIKFFKHPGVAGIL